MCWMLCLRKKNTLVLLLAKKADDHYIWTDFAVGNLPVCLLEATDAVNILQGGSQ